MYEPTRAPSFGNAGDFTVDKANHPYSAPPPVPPTSVPDEYNPEQEPETWSDADGNWTQSLIPSSALDTPESPPMFEKEGYVEGAEYHDNVTVVSGTADVDHRVLRPLPPPAIGTLFIYFDNCQIVKRWFFSLICFSDNLRGRGKDVDHRNLISLTGSPADNGTSAPSGDMWNPPPKDQVLLKKKIDKKSYEAIAKQRVATNKQARHHFSCPYRHFFDIPAAILNYFHFFLLLFSAGLS